MKAWLLKPGEVAEVISVDEDGDFMLQSPGGVESGFLFRAEFVYALPIELEVAHVTPQSVIGVGSQGDAVGPAIFEVVLPREDGEKVGLGVDAIDDSALEIVEVASGALENYNDNVSETRQVQEGYFIVGVNGKTDALGQELLESEDLRLKLARNETFRVNFTKRGPLGVKLGFIKQSTSLQVSAISGGSLEAYNRKAAKEKNILVGDRIIEVNGISRDVTGMLEAMQKNGKISMTVSRPHT